MSFISIKGVSYSYDKGREVFSGLDLEIARSGMTAIMGPNGSGKTTLTKLILGILRPDSGRIFLDGDDIGDMSLGQIGCLLGYLFQNPELQIFANSVFEDLSFVLKLKGLTDDVIGQRIDSILSRFNLDEYRDSSPFNLSFGEKQRLAIAGILVNEPSYLILDEPTTGLDFKRKDELGQILKELMDEGKGITVITHDREFVDDFDAEIVLLSKEGRICRDQK